MQPNYENIVKLGKQNDYIYQALAHMGNATHVMSWANNCVEDVKEVPEELKSAMRMINSEIHRLQEKLREIRSAMKGEGLNIETQQVQGKRSQYVIGTLGHLLENYLEPMLKTTLIVYEESADCKPAKLLFDSDCNAGRVYEYLRTRQVNEMYDAEGGGFVVIVSKEL